MSSSLTPITPSESSPRTILSSATWVLAGNCFFAFGQWLVVVLLARSSDLETFGAFTFAQAIVLPLILLSSLDVRSLQATDTTDRIRFADCLVVRSVTAITLIVFLLLGLTWLRVDTALMHIFVPVLMLRSIDFYGDPFFGYFQKHHRLDLISKSLSGKITLQYAFLLVVLWSTQSVVLGIWAMAGASLIGLVLFDIVPFRGLHRTMLPCPGAASVNLGTRYKHVVQYGLPLGCLLTLNSLLLHIPRYFVAGIDGTVALGIFSGMLHLLIAGNTVATSLATVAMRPLALSYARGATREFLRRLGFIVCICLFMGIVGYGATIFSGGFLLTTLFGSRFTGDPTALNYLMLGSGTIYLGCIFNIILVTTGRFYRTLVLQMVYLGLLTVCCAVLVPAFGVRGACLSLSIASLIMCLIYAGSLGLGALGRPLLSRGGAVDPGNRGTPCSQPIP